MRILPIGATAVLVDEVGNPAGWAAAFRRLAIDGVVEVVPAVRTVLIAVRDETVLSTVRSLAPTIVPDESSEDAGDEVVIDVVYDGRDLADVADAAGLSQDRVVELHSGASYRVAFCGFAPGFAYLTGLPTQLHLPRRPTPRTRVPAGSVAIASEYAAVYPTESPGGWHLLGSTGATLFDVHRDPPAALVPGRRVRFRST